MCYNLYISFITKVPLPGVAGAPGPIAPKHAEAETRLGRGNVWLLLTIQHRLASNKKSILRGAVVLQRRRVLVGQ